MRDFIDYIVKIYAYIFIPHRKLKGKGSKSK